MKEHSDEDLFLAFQRNRDQAALSTLFRRRADELLRLAVFLSPRPSEADDLLQATFLSAISRAETYRPGNRVMSWLCGILTNHARMLRRSDRRRAPDAPPAEDFETPVDAALQQEVARALQDGIAGLKEPYRSVMRHHLQDGLNSHQIGEQMNQKPATVRKQMARAIEKLRAALPLGLATGVAMRLTPAQIADRAVEAAPFIGGDGVPVAFDSDDDALPDGVPVRPLATWLPATLGAAAITGAAAIALSLWPTASLPPPTPAPAERSTPIVMTEGVTSPPVTPPMEASETERLADLASALTVHVIDAEGRALDALPLLCVLDDGRPLQSRILDDLGHTRTTDRDGVASFNALRPGIYDLTLGGAVSKSRINVTDAAQSLTLRLPRRHVHAGEVTDRFGRPVADAEVWVTETAGRADLPALLARTDATGRYRVAYPLNDALVFARHKNFSQSATARLSPGLELRLALSPPSETITVEVLDANGQPVKGALCASVPRSQSTTFFAPTYARTGADGTAQLPGPGQREGSLLVQHEGCAPTTHRLDDGAARVSVVLQKSKVVIGTARRSDGSPLAGKEVIASVAGARTNEPTGPLLARRALVGEDGSFVLTDVPSALLHVRIVQSAPQNEGPPLTAFVVAGVDLDTREGERFEVELLAPTTERIHGTLTTSDGRVLAGHLVMAVPSVGVAGHRLFRRRLARTNADGEFEITAVASNETYELAVFPPRRWWPNPPSWPTAFATARCGQECHIVIATTDDPTASLSCQAVLPDGRPASDATYELRHLAYQTPMTRPADPSGRARFDALTAGDYWLAVRVQGVGNKTVPVRIDAGAPLVLPALQLEAACELTVRLTSTSPGLGAGARVVARNVVGDKFVASLAAEDGTAALRPLPPGASQLLVYGDAIAPVLINHDLTAGKQWLDVQVAPANPVRLSFPFALADNPFLINGPLHVRVYDSDERVVLEDYLGAATSLGRFTLAFGLPEGRYRVVARSIWNALGEADITVTDGQRTEQSIRLGR